MNEVGPDYRRNGERIRMSKSHDPSERDLVQAIEGNMFEFFMNFRRWREAEIHDDPDMLWSITSIPFPLFNSVLRAKLEPQNVDAVIEATLSRYKARDVPMMWWTGPATRPKNLGTALVAHGLVSEEGDSPGMAADLRTLNENSTGPPRFDMELVKDAESLGAWAETLLAACSMPGFVAKAMFHLCTSLGYGKASMMRHYYGRLDGEGVATSSLFLAAGVARIYNVSTLPRARHQGIGAAMTLEPLREARALGYTIGVLTSTQLGVGVYRRIGFEEYCKVGQYVWIK